MHKIKTEFCLFPPLANEEQEQGLLRILQGGIDRSNLLGTVHHLSVQEDHKGEPVR